MPCFKRPRSHLHTLWELQLHLDRSIQFRRSLSLGWYRTLFNSRIVAASFDGTEGPDPHRAHRSPRRNSCPVSGTTSTTGEPDCSALSKIRRAQCSPPWDYRPSAYHRSPRSRRTGKRGSAAESEHRGRGFRRSIMHFFFESAKSSRHAPSSAYYAQRDDGPPCPCGCRPLPRDWAAVSVRLDVRVTRSMVRVVPWSLAVVTIHRLVFAASDRGFGTGLRLAEAPSSTPPCHSPQCRPSTGAIHERSGAEEVLAPQHDLVLVQLDQTGGSGEASRDMALLSTEWRSSKNAGVLSGNGFDPRQPGASAPTSRRRHQTEALTVRRTLRPGKYTAASGVSEPGTPRPPVLQCWP